MKNISSLKIRVDRKETSIPESTITSSIKSYEIFKAIFAYDDNDLNSYECSYALLLDQANKVLGIQKIGEGAVNSCHMPINKVAQAALLSHANTVILCHNHPSGNLRPSAADIDITSKAKQGLALLDILVLDHIIIGEKGYYSFADEGMI